MLLLFLLLLLLLLLILIFSVNGTAGRRVRAGHATSRALARPRCVYPPLVPLSASSLFISFHPGGGRGEGGIGVRIYPC